MKKKPKTEAEKKTRTEQLIDKFSQQKHIIGGSVEKICHYLARSTSGALAEGRG